MSAKHAGRDVLVAEQVNLEVAGWWIGHSNLRPSSYHCFLLIPAELPGVPAAANPAGEDPLVIAVIFISIVTIGILALMGFLKYRKHNNQLQFRRLQDLPMVSAHICWVCTLDCTNSDL